MSAVAVGPCICGWDKQSDEAWKFLCTRTPCINFCGHGPAWVRGFNHMLFSIPPLLSAACWPPACGLARATRLQSCVQGPCWWGMGCSEFVAWSKDVMQHELGVHCIPLLAGT